MTKHIKRHFTKPISVPNDGRFREGVEVRLVGYERFKNGNNGEWLSTMLVEWRLPERSHEWSTSRDIVTGMTYADWYPELHSLPRNPNARYGKKGRPLRQTWINKFDEANQ